MYMYIYIYIYMYIYIYIYVYIYVYIYIYIYIYIVQDSETESISTRKTTLMNSSSTAFKKLAEYEQSRVDIYACYRISLHPIINFSVTPADVKERRNWSGEIEKMYPHEHATIDIKPVYSVNWPTVGHRGDGNPATSAGAEVSARNWPVVRSECFPSQKGDAPTASMSVDKMRLEDTKSDEIPSSGMASDRQKNKLFLKNVNEPKEVMKQSLSGITESRKKMRSVISEEMNEGNNVEKYGKEVKSLEKRIEFCQAEKKQENNKGSLCVEITCKNKVENIFKKEKNPRIHEQSIGNDNICYPNTITIKQENNKESLVLDAEITYKSKAKPIEKKEEKVVQSVIKHIKLNYSEALKQKQENIKVSFKAEIPYKNNVENTEKKEENTKEVKSSAKYTKSCYSDALKKNSHTSRKA